MASSTVFKLPGVALITGAGGTGKLCLKAVIFATIGKKEESKESPHSNKIGQVSELPSRRGLQDLVAPGWPLRTSTRTPSELHEMP